MSDAELIDYPTSPDRPENRAMRRACVEAGYANLKGYVDMEKEGSVPDREVTMKRWDYWRREIAEGNDGSSPRDWLESELDARDEIITAQKAELERLRGMVGKRNKQGMRRPSS